MGFMYEFPHTNNFDSDLREILDKYLELRDLPTKFAALEKTVANGELPKRFIFVSDSYGVQEALGYVGDTWVEKAIKFLGLTKGVNAYKVSVGGVGFATETSFTTILRSIENTITEPDTITDIIVCGGCNDNGRVDGIDGGIISFIDYCRNKYPNATIKIGHIGWFKNSTMFLSQSYVINKYRECIKFGAEYLNNVEYALHNYNHFYDAHHPNALGSEEIGVAVATAIKCGSANVGYVTIPTITTPPYVTAPNSLIAYCHMDNGMNNLSFLHGNGDANYVTINFAENTNIVFALDNELELAYINGDSTFWGDHFRRTKTRVSGVVWINGLPYDFDGDMYIKNGALKLVAVKIKDSGYLAGTASRIDILGIEFNCPTLIS